MKDLPTIDPPSHAQTKLTIVEADVDIGIIHLVNWLNSFYCIMTRWSCEGKMPHYPPYITIWVYDSPLVLEQIKSQLDYPSACITPECTQGKIHVYHIAFSSKKEMKRIQKEITGE